MIKNKLYFPHFKPHFKCALSVVALSMCAMAYCANTPKHAARSESTMVVSAQHLATQVGLDVLSQGGNAVDAAVAMGYALAVVHPCCGNLGGGGFMLLHMTGQNKPVFINFRETAPAHSRASAAFDAAKRLEKGRHLPSAYRMVGIPGTVKGLNFALKQYGTWSLKRVLKPAISLAKMGFLLNQQDVDIMTTAKADFEKDATLRQVFLHPDGTAYRVGERWKQPVLAQTLSAIAENGDAVFYRGYIANQIIKAASQYGVILTKKAFTHYAVEVRQPIECQYRGYTIFGPAPPSSGGVTICQIMRILSAYPMDHLGTRTPQSVHYLLEAMRFAFADRNSYLGDPNFINNPINRLLSDQHIHAIRQKIDPHKATDSNKIGFVTQNHTQQEGQHTTHFSVVDKDGNAVSTTVTLNDYFGAKIMPKGLGFLLNDTLKDFAFRTDAPNAFHLIQSKNNLIAPGKRPLSSMSPTLVFKGKSLRWILGSPGGPTIITQIAVLLHDLIDLKHDLLTATDAARFHMQWLPDCVYTEKGAFDANTIAALQKAGYRLQPSHSPFNTERWGGIAAIEISPLGSKYGVIDQRRPGGLALGH